MSECSKYKLSECCLSISDGDHLPPPKVDAGIPFITISDIDSSNRLNLDVKQFVPEEYYNNLKDIRKAQRNDILYSVVGSFGIPVIIKGNDKFAFQRHIAILRPDSTKVIPDYLFYIMKTYNFYMQADSVAIGAAQRTISLTALRNMTVELPSMDVQKKIATVLSRYDSLIENYQKQIKLLEEAAQRLYKEWFAQNNNLETIKLVDISSKITDGVHNTVYNEEGSPYKLLSCKNVVGGHLMISSSERSISKDTFEKLRKRTQLEKGDILVSTVGSVGEVVYLDIEPDHFEFQRSVGIIKADKNVITPLYVYYSLLNRKNELKRTAHGAAQQCLFISDLKNFEIPIGSKEQIQNFEHFAKPISERITNARHQLRLLTESRDRLLPKLLSGEIEV